MNNNVFNQNTGDIISQREQIKKTNLTRGFAEIGYTSVEDLQQQNQIQPRQVRTGQTRGDQQIHGMQKVEDDNGRIVVMLGHSSLNIF